MTSSYTERVLPNGNTEFQVNGFYDECPRCHAAADEPVANITKVTLRRAPNPAGRQLPTSEPIYMTPHTLPCVYEDRGMASGEPPSTLPDDREMRVMNG